MNNVEPIQTPQINDIQPSNDKKHFAINLTIPQVLQFFKTLISKFVRMNPSVEFFRINQAVRLCF